jgi:hypothetical protein
MASKDDLPLTHEMAIAQLFWSEEEEVTKLFLRIVIFLLVVRSLGGGYCDHSNRMSRVYVTQTS